MNLKISKPEETLNEEIFNKLYPNSSYKLNDLLSNSLSIEEIKKILSHGLISKQSKTNSFQNFLSSRKKLFNTYTLPSLKQKQTKPFNETKSATFSQTPQRKASNFEFFSHSKQSEEKSTNFRNFNNKFHFVKSPTIKLTYQLGPALTDTHSIHIQGKLLERIMLKNKKQSKTHPFLSFGMQTNLSQEKKKNDRFPESTAKKKLEMPQICIHEVEFAKIY